MFRRASTLTALQPSDRTVKISFCTTCFRRGTQLAQTICSNAAVIAANSDVEWIILGYSDDMETKSLVSKNIASFSRRITYVHDERSRPWHLSTAKNLAHRLATGRILMNLDCDNYIGNGHSVIRAAFAMGHKIVHQWSGVHGDGTCGRIAIARDIYYMLGGYDEALEPMGYQDVDLLNRAFACGISPLHAHCDSSLAIPNSKLESVRHVDTNGRLWAELNQASKDRSSRNIARGELVANTSKVVDDEVFALYYGSQQDIPGGPHLLSS